MARLPAVSNTLPAIKKTTDLQQIDSQCEAIEAWAEHSKSIPDLQETSNRLAAIDRYLASKTKSGRNRIAHTQRKLEAYIGVLLPRQQGKRTDKELRRRDDEVDIPNATKHDFRKMAEYPEIIEEVVAESTDEDPASRRKVMRAIKEVESSVIAPSSTDGTASLVRQRQASVDVSDADWEKFRIYAQEQGRSRASILGALVEQSIGKGNVYGISVEEYEAEAEVYDTVCGVDDGEPVVIEMFEDQLTATIEMLESRSKALSRTTYPLMEGSRKKLMKILKQAINRLDSING
jgi:hypothetical protein